MSDAVPRVTVVIPTHSREQLLFDHALASALGQLAVEIEVIVVCDDAPDSLVRRVKGLTDPPVTVIRLEACGVAHKRNAGIDAARGDWVAFLDDDDLWAPSKLAAQAAAAVGAGADFAYCAALIVDDQLRINSLTPAPSPDGLLPALLARNVMPGGGSNLMARRDLLLSAGGFDTEFHYMSDWDMALRLAIASTGAAVCDPLVAWVRHANATAPSLAKARDDLRRLAARYEQLSLQHGVRFDDAGVLVWVGKSELESGRRGYRLRAARAFAEEARIARRPSHLGLVGRAVLGRRVDRLLRDRLKAHPSKPIWLASHTPVSIESAEPLVSRTFRARNRLPEAGALARAAGRLPSIDIVVPTMDRPEGLGRLLESMVAQSYPGLRVVLVDMNENEAEAADVLDDYLGSLEILHLRVSRRGVSAARNAGIERVQAEIVSLSDDDCWYPDGLLRTIGARFGRNPELAGLSTMQVDEHFRPSNGRWARRPGLITGTNVWGRGVAASMFFRASALKAVGPFDEALGVGSGVWEGSEETDLLLRFVNAGYRVEYDPSLMVHHPDPGQDGAHPVARRQAYAQAMGHVMRKHRFPFHRVAYHCARPLVGSGLAAIRGDFSESRIRLAVAASRARGWAQTRPSYLRPPGSV